MIAIVKRVVLSLALLLLSGSCLCYATLPSSTHDKGFWHSIASNKYQIPPSESAFALAQELSSYLASPDPELRDDLAYSILSVWIVRRQYFSADELLLLEQQWAANLRAGIDESGTDTVFKRSFSALCLASIAERDLKTPFLGEQRFRTLLEQALAYLRDEKDVRGFDPAQGWIHSAAHAADLLAALVQNPFFTKQDQSSVLDAIAVRLASAGEVFTYGEQDRLANVVAVIATRPDFEVKGFNSWLASIDAQDGSIWNDSPPNAAALKRFQNDSYMLRAIVPQLLQRPSSPASLQVQQAVLKSLQRR